MVAGWEALGQGRLLCETEETGTRVKTHHYYDLRWLFLSLHLNNVLSVQNTVLNCFLDSSDMAHLSRKTRGLESEFKITWYTFHVLSITLKSYHY